MSQEVDDVNDLLMVLDTAVWCWNVKKSTPKGRKIKVDWKAAFNELSDAYHAFRLKSSKEELVCSESNPDNGKPK